MPSESGARSPLSTSCPDEAAETTVQAHILGGQVEGKVALMFDDMISTAGSITGAAKVLHEHGAKEIHVAATHAVLCGPAIERLTAAHLNSLVVTDSIPLRDDQILPQTQVLTVARCLAKRSSVFTAMNPSAGCSARSCQPAFAWKVPVGERLRTFYQILDLRSKTGAHLGLKTAVGNGTISGFPALDALCIASPQLTDFYSDGTAMSDTLKTGKS